MHRQTSRIGLAFFGGLAALIGVRDAHAQISGSAGRPLPNVLLLVDNSGSMERKTDNDLPNCAAGSSASQVNRWGMVLQALTGNFQPYFSCAAVSRSKTTNPNFAARYAINGVDPYDVDYFLPYNQPMTGSGADACVIAPWKLPGAPDGSGVGSAKLGSGGNATEYPDDALAAYKYSALGTGLPALLASGSTCVFDQNNDGQLDVARQYARFALMTFDSLTERETGLSGTGIDTTNPFLGQWSYLRHTGNPFKLDVSNVSSGPGGIGEGAQGMPVGCSTPSFQEVGARNAGAPPWEGRLIPFPHPDATIYDLEAQNLLIQQTLLATRPFGATPIDGLMDDARDYLLNDPDGPGGEAYKCRDKYVVLLTDGAPNLSLRPQCEGAVCPYPKKAEQIANEMFNLPDASRITTFVIGFSVNGISSAAANDGFPGGLTKNDCKTWFDTAAGGATDDAVAAQKMQDACVAQNPPLGSTAEACCELNRIAFQGSGQGAFFAESQADINLAFGRIMANIIHSASTKTIPAFAPATQFSSAAFAKEKTSTTTASSAEYISSYIPSSQTPWAGELDRTRYMCESMVSTPQPQVRNLGDFQSENLAVQSHQKERIFFSVVADKSSSAIDSAATIRPFATNSVDALGNPIATGSSPYVGKEVVMKNYDLAFESDWPLALNITNKTCRAGRAVGRGNKYTRGSVTIPALDDVSTGAQDCSEVAWGFATSYPDALTKKGYDFNVRCSGATAESGKCSISGATCSPDGASTCPSGETCVPDCAAMGSIYHATPAVVAAPSSLLREEGFRLYQAKYAKRRTVMYAATTDGLLHAFDAMLEATPQSHHELWAFAPPAVLPRLANNYPAGNQIILDGAPVVKETVWDRTPSQLSEPRKWHTTLVAGLGQLGGYYAMNVTDGDCSDGAGADSCLTKLEPGTKGVATDIGLPADTAGTEGTPKRGPHFLWQLTDVPAETGESGKIVRDSTLGSPTKAKMTALFGKNTSTPAIGMVQIRSGGTEHQVGVAILPGGVDDPPVANDCPRMTPKDDASDSAKGVVRTSVRRWSKGGCAAPVPGRNVTIVRLDTGEILRIFGRKQDTPERLKVKLKGNGGVDETPFDSPMVGTPVVYPDQVGVPIQKIFIGDADGTLWRIDVTATDPKDWKASLFADLIGLATTADAAASQPIQVPPVLSTDSTGNIVVNVATGDQESIVPNNSLENFVYSIRETRVTQKAELLWYKRLTASERVTGPMTVFDKTLYFATYQPIRPTGTTSASCDSPGKAYLWGMSYIEPNGNFTAANGGADRWCKAGKVDAAGLCSVGLVANELQGSDLIPGVALTASQSCVGSDVTDEYGNSMFGSVTQASFRLSYGIARPNSEGHNKAQAARSDASAMTRPLPRMATQISSWSLVLE